MAAQKIVWTNPANDDFDELIQFVEQNWSPEMAIKCVNTVYKALDQIEQMPGIGVPSQKVADVRRKIVQPHTAIYYKPIGISIFLLRLLDTRSNPDNNPFE